MEDKKAIVAALLPVIQMTRNGSDVTGMLYVVKDARETVVTTFNDDSHIGINVTMDSGTAMIRDICKALQ